MLMLSLLVLCWKQRFSTLSSLSLEEEGCPLKGQKDTRC